MDRKSSHRRVGINNRLSYLFIGVLSINLHAQSAITPDAQSPINQQASVISTASGLPQVDIQTPSSGGVSRNTFSQFDVDSAGAILNNSKIDTNTQLAGWITGNPLLANGTARVILAEVNSSNPSYLNGYLEVAGSSAQVVIANPSGISCKGCGFINANRLTLTTGQPIVSLGSLQGYRVMGGKIAIEGLGLDSGSASYTDIISRAVAINNQSQGGQSGGLFAKELNITTGVNQVAVNADGTTSTITPLSADSAQDTKPVFALDVAALGGMYAGKISLIGTEAGVGVRSLGELGAGSGGLSLSVDGKLTNTGIMDSLALTKITAKQIENIGTGRIYGDHVALQADEIINREAGSTAAVIAARDRLDIGTGILTNQEGALLLSGDSLHIGGSLDGDHHATGFADTVNNLSADIESLGDMYLSAYKLSNINHYFELSDYKEIARESHRQYIIDDNIGRGLIFEESELSRLPYSHGYVDVIINGGYYQISDYYRNTYTTITLANHVLNTAPSHILSGTNMTILGDDLTNDKSQIMAGAGYKQLGNQVEQIPAQTQTQTQTSGTFGRHTVETCGSINKHHCSDWHGGERPYTKAPVIIDNDAAVNLPGPSALPPNALFGLNTTNPNKPLIETDSRFASYKQWFSSDYLLAALNLDPSTTAKRYGDGFYEQKLVREQVMDLTGYRYLPNYHDDEEQYKALLDSGVSYAREFSLTPGIALSAEQMAQLTSDMVWLVAQDVTLKDGSTLTVLKPKLYVKPRAGDLSNAGTLISANMIDLKIDGDLTNLNLKSERTGTLKNSGTIAGRDVVMIDTQNVVNIGGLITGGEVAIAASNDIDIEGGRVVGEHGVGLTAGHDIHISTTTSKSENSFGLSSSNREDIDRVAGLYVTGTDGYLYAQAGNDVKLTAAQLRNMGKQGTAIIAGHDVHLETVTQQAQLSLVQDQNNYMKQGSKQDIGTSIESTGMLMIDAGHTANIKAATIHSDDDLTIHAATGINITSGEDSSYLSSASKTKSKGTVGSKTQTSKINTQTDHVIGTQLSGENISMSTDTGDITAFSAMLAAQGDVTLSATEGNVIITAEKETDSKSIETTSKGTTKYSNHQEGYITEVASDSAIKAGGNIQMNADKDIHITASKLDAQTGTIRLGDTLMVQDEAGNLKAKDSSQATDNIIIDTLALDSQTWNETQKGYRGVAKEFIKAVAVYDAMSGGLWGAIAGDVKLGSSESKRTEDTVQQSSIVTTNQLSLNANDLLNITSGDITANATQIDAGRVLFDAAKESHRVITSSSEETISNSGMKLNNDSLSLYSVSLTDESSQQDSTTTTHKQGELDLGDLTLISDHGATLLGQNITTNNQMIDLGDGNLTEGGYADQTTTNTKHTQEVTEYSVGVRHAAVDLAIAVDALTEAGEALKHAKEALSKAKRDYTAGKISKDAVNDYEINLVAATYNFTQAELGVASAAASAAASSTTYGFKAEAGATHTTTKDESSNTNQFWIGTHHLVTGNSVITGGDASNINLTGSTFKVTGDAFYDVAGITAEAAKLTHTQTTSSKMQSQSASGDTTGSMNATISKQDSSSKTTRTTHVASDVDLGNTTGSLGDVASIGSNVHLTVTDPSQVQINSLTIQSLQDSIQSKNQSKGGSVGVGYKSGSVGYNQSKGFEDTLQTNHIANITIDGIADLDKMGTQNVNITGGILTSGTRTVDETTGKVTVNDAGTLNYSGNLSTQDLKDRSYTEQRGMNLGFSLSTTKDKGEDQKDVIGGNTSIGVSHTGRETESTVKATLGKGTVVNAADSTNRDVNDTVEVTRDQITGALDANISIDNRLFSEAGRVQMIDEQKNLFPNIKAAIGGTFLAPLSSSSAAIIGLASGDQTLAQAIDTLMQSANAARFVREHPDQAAIIAAFQEGKFDGLPQTQEGLQTLADYLHTDVNVLLTTVTHAIGLKGAMDGTMAAIDVTTDNRGDVVQTLGHEAAHDLGLKNEFAADLSGLATSFGFDAGVQSNHTVINGYRLQLGSGRDAVTQALNTALLQQNNKEFVVAFADHSEDFDYSQMGDDARAKLKSIFTAASKKVDHPLDKGAVKGVGALADGVVAILDAFGDSSVIAIHCTGGSSSACQDAVDANQQRGNAIAAFVRMVGNGKLADRVKQSYVDLNSNDPVKVAKAQEAQAEFYTSLGLGAIATKAVVSVDKALAAVGTGAVEGATFLHQVTNVFVLNMNKVSNSLPLTQASIIGTTAKTTVKTVDEAVSSDAVVAKTVSNVTKADFAVNNVKIIEGGTKNLNETASSSTHILSTSIARDTTVELTQAVKLSDGTVLPAGTVVTTNGNALAAKLSDGTKIKGNVDRLVQSQPQLEMKPNVTTGSGSVVDMDGHKIYDSAYNPLGSKPSTQYRFSDPTYRPGSTGQDIYFGENIATSYYEVKQDVFGKSLYVGKVKVDNMLDLTDPTVVKQMQIDPQRLTQVMTEQNKSKVYSYTNNIANQAYDQGYSGIIYPSSRNTGTTNNTAVILFGGRYDPSKITPILNKPITTTPKK